MMTLMGKANNKYKTKKLISFKIMRLKMLSMEIITSMTIQKMMMTTMMMAKMMRTMTDTPIKRPRLDQIADSLM